MERCFIGQRILPLVAFATLGLTPAVAPGVNVFFMPGDAYFSSRLSEDFVGVLKDRRHDVLLKYFAFKSLKDVDFGGYAGFDKLAVKNINQQMRDSLCRVYSSFREASPKEIRIRKNRDGSVEEYEMNAFPLFVYNREVKWNEQRLCMKYNENWNDIPPEGRKGPDRGGFAATPAVDYEPIIRSYHGVVHDWKYASIFGPLSATVPKGVAWGIAGRPIEGHVSVDARMIQVIVLPDKGFRAYFEQRRFVDFVSITMDGVKRYEWDNSGKLCVEGWAE